MSQGPVNPFHPLPPDYDLLTTEGQRLARVAVCCKQGTPTQLVEAWSLFRNLYLRPIEGEQVNYNPFYREQFVPSPQFHYEMVHDLGKYLLNVEAAPRGGGKSVVMGTEIPMMLGVTRPGYSTALCLATREMLEDRLETMMTQLEDNEKIIDDFGKQKPPHGRRAWNRHALHLLNGSRIGGFSVEGKKRGARPRLFLLDDPEYDPSHTTNAQTLKDNFDNLLFKVVIPMLDPGCGAFWIGTMITRRSYLWHACSDGIDSDPRFDMWNRRVYDADDTEGGETLWDGKWTRDFLDMRERQIGTAAYYAEYKNCPVSSSDRLLVVDQERDTYIVTGGDDQDTIVSSVRSANNPPLTAAADVQYISVPTKRLGAESVEPDKPVVVKAADLYAGMFRFIVTDRAYSLSKHSDYSCIHVMGMDRSTLWSLDLWLGRCKEDDFINLIFKYGMAWRPSVVGVEAVGVQIQLYEKAAEYLEAMGRKNMWQPKVVPIKYSKGETKPSRIAGLEWRFNQHRVKLPIHRRRKWPYSELFNQIENFTMDLALLPFDDAVDTLGNYSKIVKGSSPRKPTAVLPDPDSYKGLLNFQQETGIPLGSAVEGALTRDLLEDARQAHGKQDELRERSASRSCLGKAKLVQ